MGTHWYSSSREQIAIEQALEAVERRIFAEGASDELIDAALAERDELYERQVSARRALEQRGEAIASEVVREWPEIVQRHAAALGAPAAGQTFLNLLQWGTDYYAETLDEEGVPMNRFAYPLHSLSLEPEHARQLALELLRYADDLMTPSFMGRLFSRRLLRRAKAVRKAALWLWFWASLDCLVHAGQ